MKTERRYSACKNNSWRTGILLIQTMIVDRWFLQIECFDPHEPFYVPKDWKTEYEDDYENPGKDWPPYHHVTEEEVLQDIIDTNMRSF